MDIYLTRHGKTVWNTQSRIQGMNNSPLVPEGIEGAVNLGHELSKLTPRISLCYSSPLPRALHTAQITLSNTDYPIPLVVEPLLREMDVGLFEGMVKYDSEKLYPEAYRCFRDDPDNYVPVDGGETYDDVLSRASEMLRKLAKLKEEGGNGPVLLISHMIMVEAIMFASGSTTVDNLRQTGPIKQTTLYKITI